MKKMIMAVAIVCATAFAQAATIGWSCAGLNNYANDAYSFFVIGQNGVTDMATVTAILDAGGDYSSYAFGSGNVHASNGSANTTAAASGKTLGAGNYTAFYVLFDSATPVAGESKYVVISGAAQLTQSIAATTASKTFAAGNAGSIVNTASNWQSFGSAGPIAPEPTSGLLLLLGMAGLALKRKHA